jgi:hypothetical protein
MLKVQSFYKIGDSISVNFTNGESAVLYKFGRDIYTTVSPGLNKKSLQEIKKDIKKVSWNIQELEKIYLCNNTQH